MRSFCLFAVSVASFVVFSVPAVCSTARNTAQEPEAGVSRALATARAERLSDLHYKLELSLAPHAESLPGRETVTFELGPKASGDDLLIDFREGKVEVANLNGDGIPTSLLNGHLRLPGKQLHTGRNTLQVQFTSRIATSGAAVTRYEDKEDGSEYLYSLFVPMDASMAFPCFDQPDLKGRFGLSVSAPADWTVISNTAPHRDSAHGSFTTTSFAETQPISTYLFAFTAGPWRSVHPQSGLPSVYVRQSQVKRAEPEVPQLQEITAKGMVWLANYFQQPFPFPKYDIVLIPGFPFGGMEHAGATFLREDGVLFRVAPTANDRFQRNILTLHELTHQWFGDLVTMRWFDDLWLKEGFAQYMAYRAVDALDPASQPWKHFYEGIKPQAYGIDETLGTTPIFQDIPNLKDAKSAYGAIVYQKAPSILKQLEFRLGQEGFRNGLRLYLREHAYANAQWSDLIGAFHAASGQDVRSWADAWVLRRGMPEITVSWSCDNQHRLTSLTLHQHDVLPDNFVWPISNEVQLGTSGDAIRTDWNSATAEVTAARGKPCPAFVFANGGDQAYGRFLLDRRSEFGARQILTPHEAPEIPRQLPQAAPSPLLRSMLWGALWDNIHVAKSAPRGYVELVLRNLPTEDDETLAAVQASHATTALHHYMGETARLPLVAQLEKVTLRRMFSAPTVGLRIVSFRSLTGLAETSTARATLIDLLNGSAQIPGVALRPLDRWSLIGKLMSLNDRQAADLFHAESVRDRTDDGQKYAWAMQAGIPDPAIKKQYFEQYLTPPTQPGAKPEDWLTQSLQPFNAWNQAALTEPYLRQALDQLPEIKRDRKIFFLGAWLSAFFGGQVSPEAENVVQAWLAQPGIDADLRRKVLENNDELERTVLIRKTFPD